MNLTTVGMLVNPVKTDNPSYGRNRFLTTALYAAKAGVDLVEIGISSKNAERIARGIPPMCRCVENGKLSRPRQVQVGAAYAFYLKAEPFCTEKSDANYTSIVRALEKAGTPFVNYYDVIYFCQDKWKTYVPVANEGVPMPKTLLYSQEALEGLLKEYPLVFLKKRTASEGKDQIVVRAENGSYIAINGNGPKTFEGIEPLFSFLEEYNVNDEWIAQQGMDVYRVDGRVLDLRVILQRNMAGELVETATFARVGAEGSYQANIAKGGSAHAPEDLFGGWKQLKEKIISLGKSAVAAMEKATEKIIGEAGLDVLLLKDGNIFFLEANTRLGHVGFADLCDRKDGIWDETMEKYLVSPMEYAKHLILKREK